MNPIIQTEMPYSSGLCTASSLEVKIAQSTPPCFRQPYIGKDISSGRALGAMNLRGRCRPGVCFAVGGVAAIAAAGTAATMFRKVLTPRVVSQPNDWNAAILKLCPHFTTPYRLPSILNNGHVETIFAALFRSRPHILYDRELLHMPDGGVVALDSEDLPESDRLPADAPVLILLPGLTGGSEDSYVQHAVVHARRAGIRAVVFNSRGTSESPVTTAQFYSASYTEDLRCVVAHVANKLPTGVPLFAAGWSLGANILTKYLGEEGHDTPITAAVAMCNPFNLVSVTKFNFVHASILFSPTHLFFLFYYCSPFLMRILSMDSIAYMTGI